MYIAAYGKSALIRIGDQPPLGQSSLELVLEDMKQRVLFLHMDSDTYNRLMNIFELRKFAQTHEKDLLVYLP